MNRTYGAWLVVVTLVTPLSVSAQSLADLAKKTAADREKAKAAAAEKDSKDTKDTKSKTFTDADLKKLPPGPGSTTAAPEGTKPAAAETSGGAPAKEAQTPAAATDTGAKHDEPYWKNRMRQLDAQLSDHEAQLAAARLHVREVEAFIRPDGKMSPTIAEQLLKAQQKVTQLAASVVNDKRAITDLEEEARQANVPPGWLRWR